MTDVLDREITLGVSDGLGVVDRRASFELSDANRLLLAALSAAGGVIHLAMVPSHWAEAVAEGVGFALAGWFQLVFVAAVVRRPSRALLRMSIAVNVALIAVWALSRTAGLPFGAHAGHAESVSFVDLTAVGLEAALILASAVLLRRPRLGTSSRAAQFGLGAFVPLGVVVLATAAMASPSARDHAAHSHGTAALGHNHTATTDDKGLSLLHNGQHGAHHAPQTLDAATQRRLDAQLAVTREIAKRYPTVSDALAAGYTRVGPFLPGIGAHYMHGFAAGMNPDGVVDDQDLRNPLMVIYEGTEPSSKVAGFMFYSTAAKEPVGFAGGNDVWHFHENICLKFGNGAIDVPYGLDHSATPEQCARAGGSILPISQWMSHVWSVPGWEVRAADGGVFAEVNPALTCADGTYYMMPLDDWVSHPLNACRSELN